MDKNKLVDFVKKNQGKMIQIEDGTSNLIEFYEKNIKPKILVENLENEEICSLYQISEIRHFSMKIFKLNGIDADVGYLYGRYNLMELIENPYFTGLESNNISSENFFLNIIEEIIQYLDVKEIRIFNNKYKSYEDCVKGVKKSDFIIADLVGEMILDGIELKDIVEIIKLNKNSKNTDIVKKLELMKNIKRF